MWAAPDAQRYLVPTVISSSGKTDFVGEYEYVGTRDYTVCLDVVSFWMSLLRAFARCLDQNMRFLATDKN